MSWFVGSRIGSGFICNHEKSTKLMLNLLFHYSFSIFHIMKKKKNYKFVNLLIDRTSQSSESQLSNVSLGNSVPDIVIFCFQFSLV